MLGEFWKSVAGSLSDRWAALGVPALVFWVGVAIVYAASAREPHLSTWVMWLEEQSTVVLVVVLLGALLVVAASAVVVSRMTTPVLRRLEGYQWPRWASRRWDAMTAAVQKQYDADLAAWQPLQDALDSGRTLTMEQHRTWAVLDTTAHRRPASREELMPTRVGNILKAAEQAPKNKYGLDSVIVWPRLWLVMPDGTRHELAAARASLDSAVAAVVWGAVFAVAVPAAVLGAAAGAGGSPATSAAAAAAAGVGLLLAWTAVRWWVPTRAETFGDLLDSAFDLHRTALYEQLRWPLPASPAEESRVGADVTEFLWRGSDSTEPRFTAKPASP